MYHKTYFDGSAFERRYNFMLKPKSEFGKNKNVYFQNIMF